MLCSASNFRALVNVSGEPTPFAVQASGALGFRVLTFGVWVSGLFRRIKNNETSGYFPCVVEEA